MTSLAVVCFYWSVRACKRVSDGLPRFRGVISGRSNSVRRLSACITGFCANTLNAVNAIVDNVTFNKLQNLWFFNVCCFACDAIPPQIR